MKKIIFISLAFFITSTCFSQGRVNRKSINFKSQSNKITKSIGWAFHEESGEWVDFENTISNNKEFKTKFKALQGKYMMSHTRQNFLSIQFKTAIIDSTELYILIIEKWKGGYEYPNIQQDWNSWKELVGYIYDKEEYEKILSIDLNSQTTELITSKTVSLNSKYESYDEKTFLDKIQTEMKKEEKKYSYSTDFTFPIIKVIVENEEFIRFHIPEKFSKYNKYDFEKEYFEITPEEFKKLEIK